MKTPLGTEVDLCTGHIVLDGFPALRERGTEPPPLGLCLLWPRSPISATAELSFQDGGRRHLEFFFKFEILTVGRVRRVELRHLAKLRGDRSNRP